MQQTIYKSLAVIKKNMKEFNIVLDYSEIDFLQTSLEVILNRQLKSTTE